MKIDNKNAGAMPSSVSNRLLARIRRAGPAGQADLVKREAIRWLSLMSSGRATEADAEALKQWCREDMAHEAAYAKAALVWDMLIPVAERAPRPEAKTGALGPAPAAQGFGRRALFGGAVSASACAAGYLVVRPPLGLWPSFAELRADIRTNTGEQRRVVAADGITIDLNTRSSLVFHASPSEDHHIELISGEAVIAAGPGIANSCIVIAGGGRVLARDAQVDIRRDGANTRVTCIDGSIRVEQAGRTVAVAAREQVVYGERGISGIGSIDPAAVTAWQRGLLLFNQEPLSRVVEEVNRYRPGEIVVLNQELGRRLIDASFHLDHLDHVITYIRQAFGSRITELPGGIVLVG
jgi:transmembrane sensor